MFFLIQNTPEHFKYAQELWTRAKNIKQLNRSRYLLAGLAIKQNNPKCALGLVNSPSHFVTVRFIQLTAYTQLGDFHKAFAVLKQSIANFQLNATNGKRPYVGKKMVSKEFHFDRLHYFKILITLRLTIYGKQLKNLERKNI